MRLITHTTMVAEEYYLDLYQVPNKIMLIVCVEYEVCNADGMAFLYS